MTLTRNSKLIEETLMKEIHEAGFGPLPVMKGKLS
jgi:hypothetical protein